MPGQKDLTLQGLDESGLPNQLKVLWDWDETSISGGNTLDACVLLDSDGDIYANYALCLTLGGQPLVKLATTLYSCGDTRVDRCSSQISVVALPANPSTSCTFAVTNNTDPFLGNGKAGGADKPRDTRAKCTLDLPEIATATGLTVNDLNLINTCSYPSQQPNSDPSDCVLIPRDATLVIAKNAGGDTTTTFGFTVSGGGTFSGNIGEGTALANRTVGIVSGVDTAVAETVASLPAGWEFVGSSCTGSTLTGGNGTFGAGISSVTVKAATGNTVTCTFTNALRPKPTLTVTKSCVPSDDGGKFNLKIDSTTYKSDATCAGGAASTTGAIVLDPGNYTVSEAAGTGTDLANYASAIGGACASNGTVSLAYGDAKTCTITNTLRTFTIVTYVCETTSGTPVLYKSTVTLPSGQNSQTTATSVVTGSTVAAMCGVAANHSGLKVGDYDPHVVIGASPAP